MTALEAIHRATEAGLTLRPDPSGLRVTGPKPVRAALLPTLRPLAAEILRLLADAGQPTQETPDRETADWPRAQASLDRPASCSECGGPAFLSLVDFDGSRTCVDCVTGRTAMRRRGVPI